MVKYENKVYTNYELLDELSNEEIQELESKRKQELSNLYYSIDLNTNKVKNNDKYAFVISRPKPKAIDPSKQQDIDNYLHNVYLEQMQNYKKKISKYKNKTYSKMEDIEKDIYNFNDLFDREYLQGFNVRVRNLLDKDIKDDYVSNYVNMVSNIANARIKEIGYDKFSILDLDTLDKKDDTNLLGVLSKDELSIVKNKLQKDFANDEDISSFADDMNREDIDIYTFEVLKDIIYKREIQILNIEIQNNIEYYKKIQKQYDSINDLILLIIDRFKENINKINSQYSNYEITKYNTNNDISIKIDPITKKVLDGSTYKVGKFYKAENNYNDKSYGAIFSIKDEELSNIDIIQELQQQGVKINHFGKKIIDDVDLLLKANQGNARDINSGKVLESLTPKMIARKVYNVSQPTSNQLKEIDEYLHYLGQIYLFFVKDGNTESIEKLFQLKKQGYEYLKLDDENILNIGDTINSYIVLNAHKGVDLKNNYDVYYFENTSIFDRLNKKINEEVGKNLLMGSNDNADYMFNDKNKYVNKVVVGIRYLLAERVNNIKYQLENGRKPNKEVLLETIYNDNDIKTPKDKSKARDIVKNVLDYWVSENIIISYQFLDKNNQEIQPNSKKEVHKIYLNVSAKTSKIAE